MTDTETLRQLTAALYEAALDPDRLPVFLKELSAVVGADATVLAVGPRAADGSRPTSVAHGLAEPSAEALSAMLDPDAAPSPGDPDAWRQALGDPLISDSIALHADPVDGRPGFLALLRRKGAFAEPARGDLERFRPHLPHALRLLRAVDATARQRDAAEALGDSVGHALAVVDGDGRMVAANKAFRDLAGTADGIALSGGRVILEPADVQDALLALLAQAETRRAVGRAFPGGALSVPRARAARPLGVVVTPLPPRGQDSLFGLHVSALEETPVPPVDVLRGLFDLTPAEAALLQALIADQRIEDVAEARGVSVTTVRTQLAHLFRKTNTNRQPELVRLATLAACCVAYPGDEG